MSLKIPCLKGSGSSEGDKFHGVIKEMKKTYEFALANVDKESDKGIIL